ncbi:MAG: SDR family NAD(P)-dependent oxidoreductase [Myxococcota bacterium]
MDHPAIARGNVAVITGGASGIGLAVARALSSKGMRVCLADLEQEALDAATKTLDGEAIGVVVDVSVVSSLETLHQTVVDRFGRVDVLMNNAGTGGGGPTCFGGADQWRRILGVNLWGVLNGLQVFGEMMLAQGTPGAIVNTGSKQGLTNPPGNPAYNISKAAVRRVTESLAAELRAREGGSVTAHLLVPGFTYTGMIAKSIPTRPPGAWTSEQVADRLLERMGRGDFYILCPDNEVTESMDHARMQWNLDDIVENRPALSRWHPDFKEAFGRFMDDAEG